MGFLSLVARARKYTRTLCFVAASVAAANSVFAMEPTGSMAIARYYSRAASLPDGRVLVAGGHTVSGSLSSMTASSEIYNPATGTFSQTGSLSIARGEHAIAKLSDGRVLVVGGLGQSGGNPVNLNSAEIYDATSGAWATTGSMNTPRRSPTALSLPDGRVLVVGGDSTVTATEVFNPASGIFTMSSPLATGRGSFASAVLADGRVLVIGGLLYSGAYTTSVEIWNPDTGTWSATGPLAYARANATATVLNNGKVLVAGGYNSSNFPAPSEIYDPATGAFSLSGSLNVPRISHAANKLADGNVVIEGGTASTWIMDKTIELYDVASGTWRNITTVLMVRGSTASELLPSGSVLYAGGSPGPTATAEIFNPACITTVNQLSPTSQSFPSGGGNGSVTVTIPAGCGWGLSYVPSWVTLTSPSSGVGSGTVTFTVAPTTSARSASIRIADSMFSVSQSAACDASYVPTLSPSSQSVGSASGSNSLYLSHSAGCSWTVSGVPSWMTITSGASGQGSANIYYSYAENTGAARSATLTITGKTFTLTQSAAPPVCPAGAVSSISPSSQSFTSAGGAGSVSVFYDAGCNWVSANIPSWITVTSGATGQGNGTFNYSVASNFGTARSATLSIAGKAFAVSQSAPATGGNCDAVPLATGVTTNGSLSSTDCRSGARGANYYTDRYSFTATGGQQIAIQLSSSAFDTYLYLKNPSGTVIASNDDSGGTTNSRIPANSGYFTLPAGVSGTYVIEVSSYSQLSIGSYSLLRLQ